MDYQSRYRETLGRQAEFGSSQPSGNTSASEDLSSLDRELVTFRGCVQSIGTSLDNPDNQREVKRLRSVIKKKISDANTKLQHQQRGTRQERIEAQQLSKQLADHVQRFEAILGQEKDLTRQRSFTGQSATLSTDGAEIPMMHYHQAQASAEREVLEQREREAEDLVELERDILDLHEIQQDLAGMVVEQGDDVGNIESNVSRAAVRVGKGKKRLEDAVALKRKSRALRCCIALLIVVPIVIILIIAIILMAVLIPRND